MPCRSRAGVLGAWWHPRLRQIGCSWGHGSFGGGDGGLILGEGRGGEQEHDEGGFHGAPPGCKGPLAGLFGGQSAAQEQLDGEYLTRTVLDAEIRRVLQNYVNGGWPIFQCLRDAGRRRGGK